MATLRLEVDFGPHVLYEEETFQVWAIDEPSWVADISNQTWKDPTWFVGATLYDSLVAGPGAVSDGTIHDWAVPDGAHSFFLVTQEFVDEQTPEDGRHQLTYGFNVELDRPGEIATPDSAASLTSADAVSYTTAAYGGSITQNFIFDVGQEYNSAAPSFYCYQAFIHFPPPTAAHRAGWGILAR